MGFQMDTSQLSKALYELEQRRNERMRTYCQLSAQQMAAQAKNEAPWTDHSGHARGGITGKAEQHGSIFTITLSGSVHYLVYLELAHKKRWAILWPVMQKNKDAILRGFAQFGGMK